MSGIITLAELLAEDESLAAERRDLAQQVHVCAGRLLELVKDLLDFSQLEAGRCKVACNSFSIADLIEEIRRSVHRLAISKQLVVEGSGSVGRSLETPSPKIPLSQ